MLIAGLGNPGPKYARNRHNYGFLSVDALLEAGTSRPLSMGKDGELHSLRLPGIEGELLALKPQTFMNLSGWAVAQVLRFYKLAVSDLIVIHDELDIPLGRMRLKMGGGLAGHNGLKSIAAETGSQDFARLCAWALAARKEKWTWPATCCRISVPKNATSWPRCCPRPWPPCACIWRRAWTRPCARRGSSTRAPVGTSKGRLFGVLGVTSQPCRNTSSPVRGSLYSGSQISHRPGSGGQIHASTLAALHSKEYLPSVFTG